MKNKTIEFDARPIWEELAKIGNEAPPGTWDDMEDRKIRAYRVLRLAVDAMMATLGCYGTISARDDLVQAVLDALYQLDEEDRNTP